MFQFVVVNVRLGTETVPSPVLLDARPMVTSAAGCEFSTMVKVALPPDSVVISPDVGVTLTASLPIRLSCWNTSKVISVFNVLSLCVPSAKPKHIKHRNHL